MGVLVVDEGGGVCGVPGNGKETGALRTDSKKEESGFF